jgi:hypothetical protein
LIREEIDASTVGGHQPVDWSVISEESPAHATPSPGPHDAQPDGPIDRFNDVEGRNEAAFRAEIRRAGAGERQDLTARVRPRVHDAPALAPNPNGVADAHRAVPDSSPRGITARFEAGRNLHAQAAASGQKMLGEAAMRQKIRANAPQPADRDRAIAMRMPGGSETRVPRSSEHAAQLVAKLRRAVLSGPLRKN